MSRKMDRREFLKLAGLAGAAYGMPGLRLGPNGEAPEGAKNVLVLVFDAWSAENVGLYGYERETMPNLARFAGRSSVYHNHFSGGIYTTPGTASLLAGTYPWTHKALRLSEGVGEDVAAQNIFNLFEGYTRLGYTHNVYAEVFLKQFGESLDLYEKRQRLFLENNLIADLFDEDYDTASLSWDQILRRGEETMPNSLFFSRLYEATRGRIADEYAGAFPRGVPRAEEDNYFLLEHATDWLEGQLAGLARPFLAYTHILPPHSPYHTRGDFFNAFYEDGFEPTVKERHLFTDGHSQTKLNNWRRHYDEFLLYIDHEFGRLVDWMEDQGMLEDTWVVVTSDHGEMFERGILLHERPVMFQPVIRIPLLIHAPGQNRREDIHAPTSAVDVLPTLAAGNGMAVPDWAEGEVLPPYREGELDAGRAIYALEARRTRGIEPLDEAVSMIVRWPYKLNYFKGYEKLPEGEPYFELFDLESDPEELENLYAARQSIAADLLAELVERWGEGFYPPGG